ncbi:MAG: carbohydrate ABC transporter permease, partial [Deinococcota bacterium]|nr:carbohydrate ABC transporter permease [Deinococcota bacterium]
PLLWMAVTSLMTLGETLQRQLLPSTPQWGNYAEAWQGANFQRYFVNTVIITTVTIAGLLVTSVLAGYAFARIRFFGRNVLFTLLLTTLMIPEAVTLIPNFLIIRGDVIPWGSWVNTLQALTVPFMASAFMIFLLRQFFARIPWDLWDAARIDGSGHLRFLLQIVVPMSTAPIMTVALLAFISSWNAFMWPLIVTSTDTWRPLMVGLYRFNSEAGPQTHLIMAGSLITILPVLVVYFLTQKQFTDAFASSGLKG